MTCEEVRLSLGAHALGALEPDEAEEIDTHLATCDMCGAELLDLEGVAGFLGKVSERDVELVSSPPRRVLDRLLHDRARRHRRGRRLTAVAAAAAVLVVGGTVWGVTRQGATEHAASAPAVASQRSAVSETGQPFLQHDNAESAPKRALPSTSPSKTEAPSIFMEGAESREFAGERRGRGVTVLARPAGDGAELTVQVTGLPAGAKGGIHVYNAAGERDRTRSWSAPRGTRLGELTLRTRFPVAKIARVDVVGAEGEVYVSAVPRK
ncbi:anti-sigma factor family protein [Nonomuraea sp. SBT364]|uniref:anti-sigma factor family protein n=1 Tax=Nonomuraea sp. SBT364 TaxID=1580530 RepID=UPI00066AD33F|nr:zf-HC2 domain-containing protein [Nonomuraea sp. SBT364]